jgi:rubrerythrin
MRQTAKRMTVHDVLATAMDLEKKAMELYTAFVSHHAAEPELRQFWLTMARHEAGHYGALALVESMIRHDPNLEIDAKLWFDEATVVRLRSLLSAYLREAKEPISVDRAVEMAIDIESSELEDVVVELMLVVKDGAWREQAMQFLLHDLGDLSYMTEKFTRNPKLLKRADALLEARVHAARTRKPHSTPGARRK